MNDSNLILTNNKKNFCQIFKCIYCVTVDFYENIKEFHSLSYEVSDLNANCSYLSSYRLPRKLIDHIRSAHDRYCPTTPNTTILESQSLT